MQSVAGCACSPTNKISVPRRLTRSSDASVPRWVPAAIVLVIAIAAGAWWMRDRMSAAPQNEATSGAVLQTALFTTPNVANQYIRL